MDPIKPEFKCPHCGKIISTKGNLKIHINGVHEGIKFGCNECDYKAAQKPVLMNHIKAKHEKQRFRVEGLSKIKVSGCQNLIKIDKKRSKIKSKMHQNFISTLIDFGSIWRPSWDQNREPFP